MLFFAFLGKSLAYTRVDFTNPAGQLVAYGSGSRPMSSVASLTEGWDQRIRSTLAGQLDMRCAIFSRFFPMHLLDATGRRRMSNSLKMGRRSSMEKTRNRCLSDTTVLDIGAITKSCRGVLTRLYPSDSAFWSKTTHTDRLTHAVL
jgi:hypothetical protein